MIKTKNKNIHLPLVIIGYILFSLLIIETLISTIIPYGIILFSNPEVFYRSGSVNIITLVSGGLLPPLLSYIIGNNSVKTKSRLNHHFTGMLFGLLSFWIMLALIFGITIPPEFLQDHLIARIVLINTLPILGVVVVSTVLAVAHARGQYAKQDILEYKPFSVSLIIATLSLPIWFFIQNLAVNIVGVNTITPLVMIAISGSISFITLQKTKLSTYTKLAWAAVSTTILCISIYTIALVISLITRYQPEVSIIVSVDAITYGLAFLAWVFYWINQADSLLKNK